MFIPSNAKPLGQLPESPIRLAILGASGSGKTHSALRTSPNPVIADFDNNLKGHQRLLADTPSIPFWMEETWVDLAKAYGPAYVNITKNNYPNKPLIFKRWLSENLPQFASDQTFIIDSWTSLQNVRDTQDRLVPPRNEKGKEDGFKFWGNKLDWSVEIIGVLKTAPCNVIVTIHEGREVDPDSGKATGKILPLMQGAFRDQMLAHFTDTVRCCQRRAVVGDKKSELVYRWQLRADDIDLKTRVVGAPEELEPSFSKLLELYREAQ